MRRGGIPYDQLQKTNMYGDKGGEAEHSPDRANPEIQVAKKKKKKRAGKKPQIQVEESRTMEVREQSAETYDQQSVASSHNEARRFFEDQMMRATGSKFAQDTGTGVNNSQEVVKSQGTGKEKTISRKSSNRSVQMDIENAETGQVNKTREYATDKLQEEDGLPDKPRSTAKSFAAKLASVSAKKKLGQQESALAVPQATEEQNLSMQFQTENQYDTQDGMLRQEAVPDIVEVEQEVEQLMSQRLSVRSQTSSKKNKSRRGSEKNGYTMIENTELVVGAKPPVQGSTAYGKLGAQDGGSGLLLNHEQDYMRGTGSNVFKKQKTAMGASKSNFSKAGSIELSNVQSSKNRKTDSHSRIQSSSGSRNKAAEPLMSMNLIGSGQQKMEFMQVQQARPMSGKVAQDSFMSDDENDQSHRIDQNQIHHANEEAKRIRGDRSAEMDSFGTSQNSSDMVSDVSSETHQFESSNDQEAVSSSTSEEEDDLDNQPIRVYDARFKIPAQSNLGQLMSAKNSAELSKGQTSKEYRNMVKRLERFKKCASVTAIVAMALSMIFNIVVYGILIRDLQADTYYLQRTRSNVTQVIDFEDITVQEIKYFLYKDPSEDAKDAGDDQNNFIATDVNTLCNNTGVFMHSDAQQLLSARDNISSPFMLVSEAYILLLMFISMIFVAIIIPQKMKEHHVPMLMRQADENMFHVMMRVRCFVYLFYMMLSGCLCHVMNYYPDTCLHTEEDPIVFSAFDVIMTDYYQFCLVSLIWFISIPVSCFLFGALFKDATRYAMIPCMITSLVFTVFTLILSFTAIFNALLNASSQMVKLVHLVNFAVYFECQLLNMIYKCRYAKRDLLRTEEEELDV